MSTTWSGKTAVVTGGSRGLGRGIVEALAGAGMKVVAVARQRRRLEALASEVDNVTTVAGDVADPRLVGEVLQKHRPQALFINAGASPLLRAIHLQTWDTFSQNWEVDVKATFHWLRDALLLPLEKGSRIFVTSSGAALHGSPLSGGYAGSKRTQWFISNYAHDEAKRLDLDITVQTLLPQLNPNTDLGRAGVQAYADRAGLSFEEYAKRFDPPLTPQKMGESVLSILTDDAHKDVRQFIMMGSGPKPLDKG